MKVRLWLKSRIQDKYFVDGEMDYKSLNELKNFGCTTITLDGITVVANEIVGWEVLKK